GAVASNGVKTKPHLVREVVDIVTHVPNPTVPQPLGRIPAKPENLEVIRKALVGVNIEGTSARAFLKAPYSSGGKTGTAQVIQIKANEKYHASKVDERHRDHALFIAYAPAEEPKIVLAMIVENAGFGAQNAAPIARRAFDYWLLGLYPSEEDMAAVREGKATTPIGKQRNAADVAWPPGGGAASAAAAAASSPIAATPAVAASATVSTVPASATVRTAAPQR